MRKTIPILIALVFLGGSGLLGAFSFERLASMIPPFFVDLLPGGKPHPVKSTC